MCREPEEAEETRMCDLCMKLRRTCEWPQRGKAKSCGECRRHKQACEVDGVPMKEIGVKRKGAPEAMDGEKTPKRAKVARAQSEMEVEAETVPVVEKTGPAPNSSGEVSFGGSEKLVKGLCVTLKEVVGELKEHRRLQEQAVQGDWYKTSILERIAEATEQIARGMEWKRSSGSESDWVGGRRRTEGEGEAEDEEEEDGEEAEAGGSGLTTEEKEKVARRGKEKSKE